MRWIVPLLVTVSSRAHAQTETSVLDDMKTVYCYTRLSVTAQNMSAKEEVRAKAKANADSLFERYQAAVRHSKGKLTEHALQEEAKKGRSAQSRDLSMAEYFILAESCARLAADLRTSDIIAAPSKPPK